MNIRFLLTVLISCLPVAAIFADQTDEVKKQINKIKKSTQYIYAESTAPTEADAQNYAEEKLYDEINKWVATQKKMKNSPNLVVNNKKSLWTTLSMPRGTNMFRSFIYVKKSDIIPTDNGVRVLNAERADYQIVSMTGSTVARGVVSGDETISTANLPKGIYVIAVDQNGDREVVKFVR